MEPYEDQEQESLWIGAAIFVAAPLVPGVVASAIWGVEPGWFAASYLAALTYRVTIYTMRY